MNAKCPKCGSANTTMIYSRQDTDRIIVTYRCLVCWHKFKRVKEKAREL